MTVRLPRLLVAVLVAVAACGSDDAPSSTEDGEGKPFPSRGASAEGSEATPPPSGGVSPEGSTAVWAIDPDDPPAQTAQSFTAMVTRLECSSGETGEVLPPIVATDTDQVVVTFSVEPLPPGGYTCPGNNAVPYQVHLDEPIGERDLVDGACISGAAVSTSFCSQGAVRWSP